MTAIFGRNSSLALGLACAWIMSIATAQAQTDQQSKKAGSADSKAGKNDESKGMTGMGGMT